MLTPAEWGGLAAALFILFGVVYFRYACQQIIFQYSHQLLKPNTAYPIVYPAMDAKQPHALDVRVTQFVFEQLPQLVRLSRQFHAQADWKEDQAVYLTAHFHLGLKDQGDEEVQLTVVPGEHLPPNPAFQQWHQACSQAQQFATHIHLACVWPGEGLVSFLTLSPHVFADLPVTPLSEQAAFDNWQPTGPDFKQRWPQATTIFKPSN